LGRIEQAYQATNVALRVDGRHVDSLIFRVRVARTLMLADNVERDMNAALLVAPDNPYLLATRADMLVDNGDPKSALRDASMAIKQKPDDADILWIKARAHMELDQLKEAEKDLDRALELEPGVRHVRLLRANLHLRRAAFEQAIADTNAILAERPHDPQALELRSMIHTANGRIDEAVTDLNTILGPPGDNASGTASMPHFNQLMVQRAILLAKLDRSAEAGRDLDVIVTSGGKRVVIRLQVFLRRNGFEDVPLDGKRTAAFDEALQACIVNQACGRGLVRSL
jgi:tetratricopeptide (TPR) repeat protein